MKGFLYKLLSGHVRQLVVQTGARSRGRRLITKTLEEVGRKTGQTMWASPCYLLADWPIKGASDSHSLKTSETDVSRHRRPGRSRQGMRW